MKNYISIAACAIFAMALAGCTNSDEEEIICDDGVGQPAEPVSVYVEVGATSGVDTKASFDKDLKAFWEAGDQILLVAGRAVNKGYQAAFSPDTETIQAGTLTLEEGEGTNSAVFRGTVSSPALTTDRYFHFAYPAALSALSTSTKKSNAVGGTDAEKGESYTYCTLTIPAAQDGVWQPSMFASTQNKTRIENLAGDGAHFTNLNSALGIRVYEKDGTTPKQVESITVAAANAIVGTFSATTPQDGRLTADLFATNASGKSITATGLTQVGKLGNDYEYRFEVLPVDAGSITVTLTDARGSVVERTFSLGKAFRRNYRHGVKVVWDSASINAGDATSWYEDYAGNASTSLSMGTVYVSGVSLHGVVESDVVETGLKINGTYNPLEIVNAQFIKSGLASGSYSVVPYAKLADGEEIAAAEQTVVVMADEKLTASIYSSYNDRNNSLNGNRIYSNASINAYVNANLVQSATLYYDGGSKSVSNAVNVESDDVAWKTYSNCYVTVTLKNGYTFSSAPVITHVTGIPYSITANSGTPSGWTTSNTETWESHLALLPQNAYALSPAFHVPATYGVKATISTYAYKSAGTYKPKVYVSAQSSGASGGSATELGGVITYPGQASFQDVSQACTLTTSQKNICIYTTSSKPGSFLGLSYIWKTIVKTCKVEYN